MRILSDREENLGAVLAGTLGVMLTVNTIYRAFYPAQVLTPEQAELVAQQQASNQYVEVNYATKAYLNVLLLKGGAALGLLALAWVLADGTPKKTFHPDPALPVTPLQIEKGEGAIAQKKIAKAKPVDELSSRLAAADAQHSDVAHKIGEWVKRWPWLVGMLRAPMVIVVGQPGSGKSSVMQTIALVRYLLFTCGVDIADLDVAKNIKKGVWMHGVAHGRESDGLFCDQLHSITGDLKDALFSQQQGHTVIFDEVSRWVSHGHLNYDSLLKLLGTAHQEWRRQNIKSIWGLHSLGVEENTGEKSCGKFTTVRDSAAILYLHPKNNAFGEPTFSGLASFKPAGEKCGNIDNFADRHTKVAIPQVFQASEILRMLGGLVDSLKIGITEPDSVSKNARYRWGRDQVSGSIARVTEGEDLSAEFSRHLKTQKVVDWAAVDDVELAKTFYRHSTSKSIPGNDGFYSVRELYRGWGRYQEDFSSTETFRAFLQELEDANLGELNENNWRWAAIAKDEMDD